MCGGGLRAGRFVTYSHGDEVSGSVSKKLTFNLRRVVRRAAQAMLCKKAIKSTPRFTSHWEVLGSVKGKACMGLVFKV